MKTTSPKAISGTREWASHNANCIFGCSHNCRYCYARAMAVQFGRKTLASWPNEEVNMSAVHSPRGRIDGTIMFPTTHDITPGNYRWCEQVIGRIVDAGNRLLIVSKPHRAVIDRLCNRFALQREQIRFRFTIGSFDDDILSYWEPQAPAFFERRDALILAREKGFSTSVSVEPLLDSDGLLALVKLLSPYVSDSIWVGKMNKIRRRVQVENPEDSRRIREIEEGQTDERIRAIYEDLKGNPLIRWKESIKKIVGLPLASEAGLDR